MFFCSGDWGPVYYQMLLHSYLVLLSSYFLLPAPLFLYCYLIYTRVTFCNLLSHRVSRIFFSSFTTGLWTGLCPQSITTYHIIFFLPSASPFALRLPPVLHPSAPSPPPPHRLMHPAWRHATATPSWQQSPFPKAARHNTALRHALP